MDSKSSAQRGYLAVEYFDYVLRKKPCSYDLSSFKTSIDVFYSRFLNVANIPKIVLKKVKEKIVHT